MESNRNDRIPTFSELIDAYNKDPRFYDGFRIGYACGSNDAIDQFSDLDQCETDYEDGWEDGYDEGYDDAVDDFFEDDESDEEITAEKPTDEESLLEFLDSLSLTEQRAALVHLSGKWAELGAEKNNEQ